MMVTAVVRRKSFNKFLFFCLQWVLQAKICARAEYADLSFTCPLRTSCQPICVSNESVCPKTTSCGEGTSLCADGSCATVCSITLTSPCAKLCESSPVTCAQPIDFYENCNQYDSFYDQTKQCVKQKEAQIQPDMNFEGFKVCYWLYSIVIASTLLWCAYNQRFRPVDGSTKTLREVEELGNDQSYNRSSTWTQTSYCGSIVGTFIYIIVLISLLGIQIMLAVLTWWYYNNESSNEQELILKAFIVTWMLGFIWSFVLKWPSSIHSLFLRRCLHRSASFVAVYAPTQSTDGKQQRGTSDSYISKMKYCLNAFKDSFHVIMSFIFSGVTSSTEVGHITYCRVYQESSCRYFYFRLRRYNYDPSKDEFVPGYWDMGNSVRDLLDAKDGLHAPDVEERKQAIGPNSIRMKKPRWIRTVTEEFSNSYYTYQNFIIWSVIFSPTRGLFNIIPH